MRKTASRINYTRDLLGVNSVDFFGINLSGSWNLVDTIGPHLTRYLVDSSRQT